MMQIMSSIGYSQLHIGAQYLNYTASAFCLGVSLGYAAFQGCFSGLTIMTPANTVAWIIFASRSMRMFPSGLYQLDVALIVPKAM
jgi:hypothetical protein